MASLPLMTRTYLEPQQYCRLFLYITLYAYIATYRIIMLHRSSRGERHASPTTMTTKRAAHSNPHTNGLPEQFAPEHSRESSRRRRYSAPCCLPRSSDCLDNAARAAACLLASAEPRFLLASSPSLPPFLSLPLLLLTLSLVLSTMPRFFSILLVPRSTFPNAGNFWLELIPFRSSHTRYFFFLQFLYPD